jgi:hypothetical protein
VQDNELPGVRRRSTVEPIGSGFPHFRRVLDIEGEARMHCPEEPAVSQQIAHADGKGRYLRVSWFQCDVQRRSPLCKQSDRCRDDAQDPQARPEPPQRVVSTRVEDRKRTTVKTGGSRA